MAKTLNDILKGVNKSKEVPNDLTDLAMSPEGNKGELDFAKKHKIQKHEDRAGNGDDVYNASKIKTAPYKKQDQKVYEAAECNHSGKGTHCSMHGEEACPEPKDMPKKGQKVLLDKKKEVAEGRVEDVGHKKMTKQLAALAAASNKPVTKVKPGKKQYNELKSTGSMFGGARSFSASLAKRSIEAGDDHQSVGRAKVGGKLKENAEEIQEVAPPNPKIEKWIKDNKERFVKEYGEKKGKEVLYAKAWKMHGQSESGAATETDYAGPGAAGMTTGRHDVGTL